MSSLIDLEPLSAAEEKLVEAAKSGLIAVLGKKAPSNATEDNSIRAIVVRMLLLGGSKEFSTHEKGVMLVGAYIEGHLDLDYCTSEYRLHLINCTVPGIIVANHASLRDVALNGSKICQLSAQFATFNGGLNLREGFVSERMVDLSMANIVGGLNCDGGSFCAEVKLSKSSHCDALNLQGAKIVGSLNLGRTNPDASVETPSLQAWGTVRLTEAEVTLSVNFCGAQIRSNAEKAIMGQAIKIGGSLTLSRKLKLSEQLNATGMVDFNSCEITGGVNCVGAVLERLSSDTADHVTPNMDDVGLNFSWARIGNSVHIHQSFVRNGRINFNSAIVGGQINIIGSQIGANCVVSFNADSLNVAGNFICRRSLFRGCFTLARSKIAGDLQFEENVELQGRAIDDDISALICDSIEVKGSILFRKKFRAIGRVSLALGDVRGRVEFADATLGNPSSERELMADGFIQCLTADGLRVLGDFIWRRVEITSGSVSLMQAKFSRLADDIECWPSGKDLFLDGLQFQTLLRAETDAKKRISWVSNSNEGNRHAQTYQNLGAAYERMGYFSRRMKVMVAMERNNRKANRQDLRKGDIPDKISWIARLLSDALYSLVEYGYNPAKVSTITLILIFATAFAVDQVWKAGDFAPSEGAILASSGWQKFAQDQEVVNPAMVWSQKGNEGQDYETFKPHVYAIDIVVPIIDLAQDTAWSASTERSPLGRLWHHVEWVLRVLGWIVAGLLAASLANALRRD